MRGSALAQIEEYRNWWTGQGVVRIHLWMRRPCLGCYPLDEPLCLQRQLTMGKDTVQDGQGRPSSPTNVTCCHCELSLRLQMRQEALKGGTKCQGLCMLVFLCAAYCIHAWVEPYTALLCTRSLLVLEYSCFGTLLKGGPKNCYRDPALAPSA